VLGNALTFITLPLLFQCARDRTAIPGEAIGMAGTIKDLVSEIYFLLILATRAMVMFLLDMQSIVVRLLHIYTYLTSGA
jgi:hypothetical protein